jgi:hypothetical protein
MSSETTQDPGAAADEIAVGDTVRFREGRTGTFEPDTQLVVKEIFGSPPAWFTADVGRTEVFLRADRVENIEIGD